MRPDVPAKSRQQHATSPRLSFREPRPQTVSPLQDVPGHVIAPARADTVRISSHRALSSLDLLPPCCTAPHRTLLPKETRARRCRAPPSPTPPPSATVSPPISRTPPPHTSSHRSR